MEPETSHYTTMNLYDKTTISKLIPSGSLILLPITYFPALKRTLLSIYFYIFITSEREIEIVDPELVTTIDSKIVIGLHRLDHKILSQIKQLFTIESHITGPKLRLKRYSKPIG